MDLAQLRPWQWMASGVALGALVGFAWVGPPATVGHSGDHQEFRNLVLGKATQEAAGRVERLRHVRVFEPVDNVEGKPVYQVQYELLKMGSDNQPRYVEQGLYADTPFFGQDSITQFLTKNKVSFSDRAGPAKYVPVGYGALGGFVLIGLVWPPVIRLMVRAGFVPEPIVEEKPPREAWWKRLKSSGAGKRTLTLKPGVDGAALDAVNGEIESRLMQGLSGGNRRATADGANGEPVSSLMSGDGSRATSDPTADAAAAAEAEKKEYKGDWYPVARPAAKREDAH